MEHRPLIIIGSGPAGTATALHLLRQAPELARQALVLEKAVHPRPKVCAGGLIPHTLACLRELDVPLAIPHVVVHRAQVATPREEIRYDGRDLCRIVRRDAFDALLVRACRDRGVEVRENEKVCALRRDGGRVRVETSRATYTADAVVGADGSGSRVRRALLPAATEEIGRAIMCDVPIAEMQWPGFEQARYDFIFRPVTAGVRGYAWVFPCLIDGVPHANVGVYSVDAAGRGRGLHALLRDELRRLNAVPPAIKAFPIRWQRGRATLAAANVLLVGDAAGADPLMGEGISFAFEYGRHAAAALAHGFACGDVTFAGYTAGVNRSWMGTKFRRLHLGVRLFYGAFSPLWFALAGASRTAQDIGIRWYNGVDGWDQRTAWQAAQAWWRGEFEPAAPPP